MMQTPPRWEVGARRPPSSPSGRCPYTEETRQVWKKVRAGVRRSEIHTCRRPMEGAAGVAWRHKGAARRVLRRKLVDCADPPAG